MEEQMRAEQPIRSIKELAPKPSDAIKAMIAGLREIPSDSFQVDMLSFGHTGLVDARCVCFGCAATCAVHKLAGKPPSVAHIDEGWQRAEYLRIDLPDMAHFEVAVDTFRKGWAGELLLEYYGLERQGLSDDFTGDLPWELADDNWQEQLPMIEEYVKKLEAAGF